MKAKPPGIEIEKW